MKSNKYWKDRANLRMAIYHKNSDETIFKISNAYDKAIEDITNDINKIFYKFATDGDLSEADARILLNSKIPKKELDEIRAKINFIEDTDLKKYLMSQLNADAYKARITRLEALKESIYINTKKAADVELQQSQLGYINNIKESYYRNIYDIQKGTGIVTDFATLPVNAIEEILKNNWSGKHYSERVWDNSDVLASKLEEVITSGIMSGKNSKKMAAELEELSTYGKMAAERLVRTETTYVTNMAELESYKELDIDTYIFVATLDLRTSPMCREMDGKIIEISKGIPGENLPPLHPWCRSTTMAYFEGMTRRRRARDPETGKNYIVEDMDYKEWYQKFVDKGENQTIKQSKELSYKELKSKKAKLNNEYSNIVEKKNSAELDFLNTMDNKSAEQFRILSKEANDKKLEIVEVEKNITSIQSEKRSDVEKYLVDNNICRSVKLTDDMSIESMNAIKDTLNNLVNGEGLPPLESVRYAPAQCKMMGSVASYDWTKKEMLLSDQILDYDNYLLARKNSELNWKSFRESKNIDTISKQQMEEHLKEMNSAKDTGHKKLAKVDYDMALINSNTTRKAAIETVEDVITHEFGHHIHNIVTEQSKVMTPKGFKKTIFGKNVLKIDKNNSWSINNLSGKVLASKVSGYATDSPLECFAESFLAYKKGINIPAELKEMIEEALKIIE